MESKRFEAACGDEELTIGTAADGTRWHRVCDACLSALGAQFAKLLADRAGTKVDAGVFHGNADHLDAIEVGRSDAYRFCKFETVIAADEGRSAAISQWAIPHDRHAYRVRAHGIAAHDEQAGRHLLEPGKPWALAASNRFDSIYDGEIYGANCDLIDDHTRHAIPGVARRIGMQLRIDTRGRFGRAFVEHRYTLLRGAFVATWTAIAAVQ